MYLTVTVFDLSIRNAIRRNSRRTSKISIRERYHDDLHYIRLTFPSISSRSRPRSHPADPPAWNQMKKLIPSRDLSIGRFCHLIRTVYKIVSDRDILIHFYATGRCCSLGLLAVQTLPPVSRPVSVSRVFARGTSLARLRQSPLRRVSSGLSHYRRGYFAA